MDQQLLLEVGMAAVVIPWVTWVSVSIFNQRQELALSRQSHDDLRNLVETLIGIVSKQVKKKIQSKTI